MWGNRHHLCSCRGTMRPSLVLRAARWLAPLSLLALVPAFGCSATSGSDDANQRIQGGEADTADLAVGLIHFPGGGFCTGTLVAPDIVLTAGHCVTETSDFFYTGTGVETPDYQGDASVGTMTPHAVAEVKRFPTFTYFETCPNPALDMGLIKLKEPITDIAPVRFGGTPFVGMTCRAIGFGTHTLFATDAGSAPESDAATSTDGGTSSEASVDDASAAASTDAAPPPPAPGDYYEGKRTAAETVIALGDGFIQVKYGTGIADHGDSGGPLLCDGAIMGTTSCHNDGDVPAHQIEYYARVDVGFDWIQARIASWEEPDAGTDGGALDAADDAADAGSLDAETPAMSDAGTP